MAWYSSTRSTRSQSLPPSWCDGAAENLRIVELYFHSEPYAEAGALDYLGKAQYPSTAVNYWFMHTLSGILMGLVDNGFAIEYFAEYATAISPEHNSIEAAKAGIPLSYILLGRKRLAS